MPHRAPRVSVVIPVYNDPDGLRTCLKALEQQTYPSERFEVIVVDNASTEPLNPVVDAFPAFTCVLETKRGSYAARNRGINEADGDIIAFTDADCTPTPQWLSQGVNMILQRNADLVAGSIEFTFHDEHPNPWEFVDSSLYLQQKQNVSQLGAASTANLFVTHEALSHHGTFNDDLQSGGDFELTTRMTEAGATLLYAPGAVVRHPARSSFRQILKRDIRVQKGSLVLRRTSGHAIRFPTDLRSFLPTKSIPQVGNRPLSLRESWAAYVIFNSRRFIRTYYRMRFAVEDWVG